jgi:hypothetical protein
MRRNVAALVLAAMAVGLGATAAYAASSSFNIPDGNVGSGEHLTVGHLNGQIDILYSFNPMTSQIRPDRCDNHNPISGYKTVAANNHSHQVLASVVGIGTCFHLEIADLPGNTRYTGTVQY